MKFLVFLFTFFVTLSFACGALWFHTGTKATLCANEKCVDFCHYNGTYIQPGNFISVKNECARAKCEKDFSISFAR